MNDKCFSIPVVTLITAFKCNLNCKHCGAYVPYLKNTLERSNDEIMKGVERFFKIVDKVELFTVTGGEPLLYKDLPDLLERILLNYSDRFVKLQIITNGTLVPSDKLIDVVKKIGNKFYSFFIDDYGPEISKKLPEIEKVLKDNDIPYFVRDYWTENAHCGGWADMGDARKEIHTLEEAQVIYEKCGVPKNGTCSMLTDKIWYPCDQVFRRLDLGLDVDPNDYVDFDDGSTVEQQRNKIRKIYDNKCLNICKFCNGMYEGSVRVKAAVQLTPEELQQIKSDLNRS